MKLISLHVDNFGTLSNYDLNFNKDLNSILQDNGWGKTTLAMFIKAMLYGLNPKRAKDLDGNERKKFEPWNNGVFGGTLVFEYKDKQYRIERTFAKKEADDVYKVFDLTTNKEVTDNFLPSVGEEIFKIDMVSFEKSMFIPQSDLNFEFGGDLTSKLADLFGNLDDCNNAMEGKEKISDVQKSITKKTGGKLADLTDEIKTLEQDIVRKENDINAIPQIKEKLDGVNQNINNINNELKEIDSKFALIGKASEKKVYKENADNLLKDIKQKQERLDKYHETLAKKDPDSIDIAHLEQLNNDVNSLNVKKQTLLNSDSFDKNEYERLDVLFKENPLDEAKIDDIKKDIAKYNSFDKQVAITTPTPINNTNKKMSPLSIALLVIGILVMILGFALIGFVLIAGIICAFIGLLALIGGLVMHLTKNNNNAPIVNNVSYVANNDPEKVKLENSLKEFFNKYKLYEMSFNDNINQLIRKLDDYKKLTEKLKKKETDIKEIDEDIKLKEKELNDALAMFKLTSINNKDKINELRNVKTLFINLKKDIENVNENYKNIVATYKLDEKDEELDFDPDELKNKKDELLNKLKEEQKDKNVLTTNLNLLNESLTTIDEDKETKDNLEQEKKDLKHRADILGAAVKFIQDTDVLIKAKYVKPMTDKVKKYMDDLLKSDALEFNVDTDFKFNGIEDSKQREIKYYSKGYQQAISICLRLALIDCLFTNEKPFLLLDDPFVDLDNEKLDQAKKMLKEIAKNIQVTYLTCHDSRNI